MSNIVGLVSSKFTPRDSETPIEGVIIHITDPIDPSRGSGVSCDHFFLTSKKFESLGFKPALGQDIEVLYNRYGKVQTLRLIDSFIEVD